jgi:hypothetical protein
MIAGHTWRLLFSVVSIAMVAGCVQTSPVYSAANVTNVPLATVTGSRVSDGSYQFEYYAIDQIDYTDVKTRFSLSLKSPDELEVQVAPGLRKVWIEGRIRAGFNAPLRRAAGMLTFDAKPGIRYQVVGVSGADSAELRLVNISSGEVVVSIGKIALTLPPPGYPGGGIPIFIRR